LSEFFTDYAIFSGIFSMAPPDPLQNSAVIDWLEVEKAVEAFESARLKNRGTLLRDYLPSHDHPLFYRVLREMIRIELEDSWSHDKAIPLEHYRHEFPDLFKDLDGLGDLAFEEYRLRKQAGEPVTPADYERRYGIDASDWPEWSLPLTEGESSARPIAHERQPGAQNPSLEAAAQSYLRLRLDSDSVSVGNLNSWRASCTAEPEKVQFFRDLHLSAPEKASFLAEGLAQLPEAGSEFLGFRLISELGRGAFGRVYLARQGDLAGRSVALKVAADVFDESQTLAKLQHTNIVPIYSIHKSGKLQAVCMPYFGTTTLADILTHVESQPSLPDSGKFVVSTLNNRRVSTRKQEKSNSKFETPALTGEVAQVTPAVIPDTADGKGILHQLAGYSYAQAVLWMASRLADGLHHAHERGILHRDLKPANILLTDEGQPMLLDFNLSADLKNEAHRATVGGTLPYMAPEHLEAFRGRQHVMDARSDLYALGVMMYELLAGKGPFPTYRGESDAVLARLVDDRMRGAGSLRQYNPAVTPATDAIIQRCLAPEPDNRYQSAGELHEDLERQLNNLPLKHTPEPSLGERTRKWMRRHPRLASTTSVGTAAVLLILMLVTGLVMRDRQVARLQAANTYNQFRKEFPETVFWLSSRHEDAGQVRKGDEACRKTLALYGLPENPDWQTLPVVRNLGREDREKLQDDLGELLLLLGKSTSLQADYYAGPEKKEEKLALAMNLTSQAEACYGPDRVPRALLEQRGVLAARLGKEREAQAITALLRDFSRTTPRDTFLDAHRLTIDGNFRQALGALRKTTQDNPANFPAWFVRGNCLHEILRNSEAIGCYNVCVALRPDFAPSWRNRGLAYLEIRNFRQAIDDFGKALELDPDSVMAHINRSRAREFLRDFPGAIADLDAALQLKGCPTRVYYLRASVRSQNGDKAGADEDLARCLKEEPVTDMDWMTRGRVKVDKDPEGALADFNRALELNPRSFDALQNKGALLSVLHRDADSLETMNQAVRFYPDSAMTRGGRGVLLARIGERKQAIADGEQALLQDNDPSTLYQVACIYALTSKIENLDRLKALQLLSGALRTGFGLDMVDTDTDLDPIRKLPEFISLVKAARALASGAAQPNGR
jgi:eukaryotic-like serine/threonine-protein kinase